MSVSVSGLRMLASGKLGMYEDIRSTRVIIVIRLSSASGKESQLEKAGRRIVCGAASRKARMVTSSKTAASRWLSPGNPDSGAGECVTVGFGRHFNRPVSGLGGCSFPAVLRALHCSDTPPMKSPFW
jgi:hypothetical protein